MKKSLIVVVILIALALLIYYFFFCSKEETQIANPAAVFCLEAGGQAEEVEFETGTDSYCVFEDGTRCWQWDFYRGDCNQGELKIETITQGEGKRANKGDTVTVDYVGTFYEDGTVFDSSIDRGTPYVLTLGEGRVITGWEYGLLGMQIGERRKLTISYNLAYGEAGYPGVIPPLSTLIFEVEMLNIE